VLPRAGRLSIPGLRAAARGELLRRDAAAADRRRRHAERAADVVVRPTRDGMAHLSALLPQPLAVAIRNTVDGYARLAGPAATRGRSVRCGPASWVIWCCGRGTRHGRRSPPISPCWPR
jgi:hypothetical protein